MADAMRVLMVTREREVDRKYGLGRSLNPVMAELRRQGVTCGYVNQDMAGARGWAMLRRLHRILARPLDAVFKGTQTDALLWGILERLNMGRLATKLAKAEGWTHLHCHDPLIGLGVALSRPFTSAKFRWGVTEHGFGSYAQAIHEDGARLGSHAMRWMRGLEARVLARADWVIFPSGLARAQTVRDLSLPAHPAHWHHVPHPRPRMEKLPRREARARLGLPANGLIVLGVGRLVPIKGFDLLIGAFAAAASAGDLLVILGEGDRGHYLALARDLGVADRVLFAVTDDVGPYYSAADLYVSTSLTESFGMANLEAMVAGLAGIYAAVGGVTEVVAHGGLLIPAGDASTLEASLRRLAADTGSRMLLESAAAERGRGWVGAAEVAAAYRACYEGKAPVLPSSAVPRAALQPVEYCDFRPPTPLMPRAGLSVLVIAPHADDETIGCGGTIALLLEAGATVKICVLSDGRNGDPDGVLRGADVVRVRATEARNAAACLGVQHIELLGLPDGALAAEPELPGILASLIGACRPDWLFVPALSDDHPDHVAAARAALAASGTLDRAPRLFMYEVWTPLPINRFVDITPVVDKKRSALACYELPSHYVDYAGATEGLMRYRGLALGRASGAAEGFLEVSGPWGAVLTDGLERVEQARHRV